MVLHGHRGRQRSASRTCHARRHAPQCLQGPRGVLQAAGLFVCALWVLGCVVLAGW